MYNIDVLGLSSAEVKVMMKAMRQISEVTCIQFNLTKPSWGKQWLAITREASGGSLQCQTQYITET